MKPATLGRTILRRPTTEDRPPAFETLSYSPSYGRDEEDAFDEEMRERQYEPCGGGRRIVRKRLGE